MTDPATITAENLREIRTARGLKQEEVAAILGLEKHNISKIERGKRTLSAPETALLNLYFFEKMPFDIVGEKILETVLDFTEDQWKVICILAKRQGIRPGVWISNQIRSYLAMDDEARAERLRLESERRASLPKTSHLQELPRVAEEPPGQGRLGNG